MAENITALQDESELRDHSTSSLPCQSEHCLRQICFASPLYRSCVGVFQNLSAATNQMQAIGRKHALQMSSTNSTSTKRNRWWTQPVRRGPDIWHRLRVGYEIMVFMIGYSFSQNKDRGVAPVNDDVWRQKKAMVSTDDTGALRPDKRPRWKRRRINQWILRWARRSRVLRGAFKNGERLPLETLQAKV